MKKIVINGDFNNFKGNTIYIDTLNGRGLNELGRRELKNLYRDNEEIRRAAKKKAQEKHLDEIESNLYKAVSEIVKSVKAGDFNKVTAFDTDIESDKEIKTAYQFLTYTIIESLKKLDDNFILSAFLDCPTDLFKNEEKEGVTITYKVKNDKIVKMIEQVV